MPRELLVRLLTALVTLTVASPSFAAVTFALRTGNSATSAQSMAIDSNQCPTKGPTAGYVGGAITNTGIAEVTGITVSLSGLGNGFSLAGGQVASQTIGTLAAGSSVGVYWYVGYGCTNGATTTPIITIASSLGSQTTTATLTARKAISANAGGNVASAVLGAGAVVGQTITLDTTYTFGGSDIADEFILQPSGGQAFSAGCFRLVASRITASNVTGVPVNTLDKLYFLQTAQQTGTGYSITVRYSFQYLCANTSTTARPYAIQTSGATNLKYTGNFDGSGSIAISYPGATNPFTITKSVVGNSFVSTGSNVVTYTVVISNPSVHATHLGKITDTLPAGVTYGAIAAGSDVTVSNSSSFPTAGSTGTIVFTGRANQSYALAGGGTVTLKYTATIPATIGTYTNSAFGTFGVAANTPIATATVTVTVPEPLTATKVSAVYSDPLNGTTDPKLIPGGFVTYTITVANPGIVAVDGNTVVVTDPTAANLHLFVNDLGGAGSGPVLYADGSPASSLTLSFAGLTSTTDNVDFSNDSGATWAYSPVPDSNGTDPLVTTIRMRPQGVMAPASNFSLLFRYRIR